MDRITLSSRALSSLSFLGLLACLSTVACSDNAGGGLGDDIQTPTSTVAPTCRPWETACGGACVSTFTDTAHCGACGNACSTGELCSAGTCVGSCADGLQACGSACVNTDASEEHCGACGNSCTAPGAVGSCIDGACEQWRCMPDARDSDGDASNGCERQCDEYVFDGEAPYNFSLSVHKVSGALQIDGEAMPPEWRPSVVVFESLDTRTFATVELEDGDPQTYEAPVFSGTYRVHVPYDEECYFESEDCESVVVEDALVVDEDTRANLTLDEPLFAPSVEVSGSLAIDGEPLADVSSGNPRATIRFRQIGRSYALEIPATGASEFSGRIPRGTYAISLSPGACEETALPCQYRLIDVDVEITEDTQFDWDFETVEFSAEITANGQALADLDEGAGRSRGFLNLNPADGNNTTGHVALDLGTSGPARASTRVYPGEYAPNIFNKGECTQAPNTPLPCDVKFLDETVVVGSEDIQRAWDLDVVTVEGEVTINGETIPDARDGRSRGGLQIRNDGGRWPVYTFGEAGPARFEFTAYPGETSLWLENIGNCEGGGGRAVPCGQTSLGTAELNGQSTLSLDATVHTVSTTVTLNGQPLPEGGVRENAQISVASEFDFTRRSIALPQTGPARVEFGAYPDQEYVVSLDTTCPGPGGGERGNILPCGWKTIVEESSIDGDRTYERDVRPVQIAAEVRRNGMPVGTSGGEARLVYSSPSVYGSIPLPTDAEGRFNMVMYRGEHSLRYSSRSSECGEVMPCGEVVFEDPFVARDGASLVVDLPSVEVEGRVSIAGFDGDRPADGGLQLWSRAVFRGFEVDDGAYGPRYVVDRPYQIEYEEYGCNERPGVPCMRALVAGCP